MLLHNLNLSYSATSTRLLQSPNQRNRIILENIRLYSITTTTTRKIKFNSTIASLGVGITDVIVQFAHNKPLIAAAGCAAVGQLLKPFTACVLYGKEFNPKAALQAGGFPSTHSSAVVATAMSIGLERGFSDSVFGLAVVYAALTMYDAQGVRREVGVHARTLNKVLLKNQPNTYSSSDPNRSMESSSEKLLSSAESGNSVMVEKRVKTSRLTDESGKGLESGVIISSQLKESIGHTEIEVAAGALLGLFASLVVYSL